MYSYPLSIWRESLPGFLWFQNGQINDNGARTEEGLLRDNFHWFWCTGKVVMRPRLCRFPKYSKLASILQIFLNNIGRKGGKLH
jgi:hypothetical protein